MMRQEVLSGVERRRRWSDAEKLRIIMEAAVEGSIVSDVARRHDITRQHIYQWRRELRDKGQPPNDQPSFVPVELTGNEDARDIVGPVGDRGAVGVHHVEIVLRNGRSLRITADVPDNVLRRLMRVGELS
jgi:transposase